MEKGNFALLLAGQGVSQIGDKFHMIALAIWVLQATGSSAKMGAVLAASVIPSLLIGLFSGVLIDRCHKKIIIVGTDVVRGVIICVFAFLFYKGMMTFRLVLLMQVLLSVNAAFFDPAVPAVIPMVVSEKNLAKANSMHQFINGFSMIVGAFAGGVAVNTIGFFAVFAINAVSFLISAGFECFIRIPGGLKPAGNETGPNERNRFFFDWISGYRYMLSKDRLLILLVMVAVIHFFVGAIEVIMPVLADFFPGGSARNLGFFQGAFGVGGMVLALIISKIDITGFEKTTLFGSVFVIGVLYVIGGFVSNAQVCVTLLFLIIIFLSGACIMLAGVSFKTLLQKLTDENYSGRVFAVAGSLGNASIPVAMMIYGLLFEKCTVKSLLMISGLVLMGVSLIAQTLYREVKDATKKKIIVETGPAD